MEIQTTYGLYILMSADMLGNHLKTMGQIKISKGNNASFKSLIALMGNSLKRVYFIEENN